MATYKVIQDIEAEDKLLGPLTLRQFVYSAVVIVLCFVSFKLLAASPFLVIPFLPPIIFFGMLAAPFGHDQSSEVWLLAKIRFFLKPRKRIWDQGGIQELVTITVPKKVEKHLTDGLTQTEVKSRLQALASTIDSRGWAVKNVNVNMYSQPAYAVGVEEESDRLVDTTNLPQDVPSYEVYARDDILDAANNPTAQHLDAMISQSEQSHRETLMASVHGTPLSAQNQSSNWFMPTGASQAPLQPYAMAPMANPSAPAPQNATYTSPTANTTTMDQQFLDKAREEKALQDPNFGHQQTISPLGSITPAPPTTSQAQTATQAPTPPATAPATSPAILRLAGNDDLNVATIAREATKAAQPPNNEIVISLR